MSKNFDPKSITNRSLARLSKKPAFKNYQKDGALVQWTENQAEDLAETARYGEFMFREMKWDTSRGFASVKHMARLVGKKLDRKRSAVGTIICTHTTESVNDTLGEDRLANLGRDILDINAESNYDLKNSSDVLDPDASKALVPWWSSDYAYSLPVGSYGRNNAGYAYVVAQTKSIKYWDKDWSKIKKNSEQLKSFYATGGWDGYKYITVPVVQGDLQTAYLGQSDNTAGQVFILDTLDIEAADRYYTRQFLYADVETKEGIERWEEVQSLSTVNATAKNFEIQILDDLSGTAVIFGDGITGAVPPYGAKITLHYLKTAGKAGNTESKFSFNRDVSGADIPSKLNVSIGFQNPWPILGGTDIETVKEFKKNAETAYAKNYTVIHTIPEFLEQLNSVSPIYLMKYKVKSGYEEQKVTDKNLSIYVNKLFVTGLTTNLDVLSTTEQNLFNTIMNQNMNKDSVFDMTVAYKEPSIIKINSRIQIEPATYVNDEDELAAELSNYLYNTYGPYVSDSLNKYQEVTLLKSLLSHYDNIAAANTFDMVELNQSEVSCDSGQQQCIITWQLPKVHVGAYGYNNTCILDEGDGYTYPFVVQTDLKGSKTTLLLNKSGNIIELKNHVYTFLPEDLRAQSNIATVQDSTWGSIGAPVVSAGQEDLSVELKIPYDILLTKLGLLAEGETLDVVTATTELEKLVSTGELTCTLSFIPSDKTMQFNDWNAILFYNNIDVTVKQ